MVLLVLPKLVAGLSPEGGETETKCRCYICVSHFLVPWVPVMPSCLVSPCCLHVPSLHETHVYQVCSPQPVMSLLTCLSVSLLSHDCFQSFTLTLRANIEPRLDSNLLAKRQQG